MSPALRLGAHVPTAGGLALAPAHARAIGADVIQIFTRNQRQWRAHPIAEEEAAAFRAAVRAHGVSTVLAHASYLLNLASPESALRRKSRAGLVAELRRSAALGIAAVVLHPGAHMGSGITAGIARVAEGLDAAIEEAATPSVRVLIEGTAGQGTSLGSSFAELAEILGQARRREQLGVCLDTCHLYAAGHDLATAEGLSATLTALARTVGLSELRALHVNDSLKGLGCRVDRHAALGRGRLGRAAFARIVNERRLRRLPLILETPSGLDGWKREIALLRRLVGTGVRRRPRR
jgi:deoxyribonuclease IV